MIKVAKRKRKFEVREWISLQDDSEKIFLCGKRRS